MLSAAWLMLSTVLYSLQLSTGSFPKPLTAQGDLEARNILIQRNLRLVMHIMNNGGMQKERKSGRRQKV